MDADEIKSFLATKVQDLNVLHYFRSYTYNWTLSAIPESVFLEEFNVDVLSQYKDRYVVARSAGKPLNAISTATTDASIQNLVNDMVNTFDQESPGRFNFYFDKVELTNLMGFDNNTGYSQASRIEFSIVEPFSMVGFFESLQTAAIAAGYLNYGAAAFMLTLEFKGYFADENPAVISDAMTIEPATRFFPIQLTKVNIRADEQGSRYDCTCVPLNEYALSTPNKLLKSITLKGKTVAEVLDDLETQLNRQAQDAAKLGKAPNDGGVAAGCDKYLIRLPKKNSEGKYVIEDPDYEIDDVEGSMASSKAGDIRRQNINFPSKNPAAESSVPNPATQNRAAEEQTPSKSFAAEENIHDCIASIIRDSTFCDRIFTDEIKLDDYGRFDYFNIGIKAKRIPDAWDYVRNKPTYTYIYYIVPYKMHISRVPGLQGDITIDIKQLKNAVRRKYYYTYTGKNLDVLKLNINYNLLYYQSTPPDMGNYKSVSAGADAALVKPTETQIGINRTITNKTILQGDGVNPVAKIQDPRGSQVKQGASNANPPDLNPYTALKNNLHMSIMDNVGARNASIQILGDPYYLVQSGIGNIVTKSNDVSPGITVDEGSADWQAGDIYVEFTVNRALDYNSNGIMKLNDTANFSGLYRVTTVTSRFSEGVFTQDVKMLMIDGQANQTGDDNATAPSKVATDGWSED